MPPSIDDDEMCSLALAKIRENFASSTNEPALQLDKLAFNSQTTRSIDPGVPIQSYLDFDNPLDPTANCPTPLDAKLKELMAKSVINDPNFYRTEPLNVHRSKRAIKKLRQEVREKTAGKNWFNFKAHELRDEDTLDRELMRMRDVIYNKKVYKRGALKKDSQSKFVQVGTWKKSPLDHYSQEFSAKNRKKTLVETLMADADFKKQNKEKYLDMVKKRSNYKRISSVGGKTSHSAKGKRESKSDLTVPRSGRQIKGKSRQSET